MATKPHAIMPHLVENNLGIMANQFERLKNQNNSYSGGNLNEIIIQ